LLPLFAVLAGCLAARGITEITTFPYPVTYQDDSTARFGDADDNVFIEVRRTQTSRPVENLAIHYAALFPGGEIIRPGDNEEYLKLDGKNAYKVVFRTKYIRKRKRAPERNSSEPGKVPTGWTPATMEDPVSGKKMKILLGPVIPQQRVLYLVQGDSYLYYIFWRADGDDIDPSRKKFEQFVRQEINYK